MVSKLILASQSPRRKQLLEWADVKFEVIVAGTDESFDPSLAPADAAIFVARQKALAVSSVIRHSELAGLPVVAADTMVVLEGRIIGKPADREDAVRTLAALSGRRHEVVTGVVILHAGREHAFADLTKVSFHSLTMGQIEYYVDKYRPYDKAGAYAIQEWIGVTGIASIDGDFYNVMGLPVSRVLHYLREQQLL